MHMYVMLINIKLQKFLILNLPEHEIIIPIKFKVPTVYILDFGNWSFHGIL